MYRVNEFSILPYSINRYKYYLQCPNVIYTRHSCVIDIFHGHYTSSGHQSAHTVTVNTVHSYKILNINTSSSILSPYTNSYYIMLLLYFKIPTSTMSRYLLVPTISSLRTVNAVAVFNY